VAVVIEAGRVNTHSFFPPIPGWLVVEGIFGVYIGLMIMLGLLFGIPILIVGVLYAKWLGKRIYQLPDPDETQSGFVRPDTQSAYNEFVQAADERQKELPSLTVSLLPIVVPIILIFINTTLTALDMTAGFLGTLVFLGKPIIAVTIGLLIAIYTLTLQQTRVDTLERMEEGIQDAGIILLVTGAGGALGNVLRESGAGDYIAE